MPSRGVLSSFGGSASDSRWLRQQTDALKRVKGPNSWPSALGILSAIRSSTHAPSTITYNAVLGACFRDPNVSVALVRKIYHLVVRSMMENFTAPDCITFSTLMAAFERRRAWKEVVSALAEADRRRFDVNANAFNSAISSCSKCSAWPRAVQIFGRMQKSFSTADVVTYNSLLQGLPWRRGVQLAELAISSRVQLDAATYSTLLSSCEKQFGWSFALELLEQRRSLDVQPDAAMFGSALSVCSRGQMWESALNLLAEARSARICSSLPLYNAALSSCERRAWQWAFCLLSQMSKDRLKPNVVTYGSLASAASRSSVWEHALSIIEEVTAQDSPINPSSTLYHACIGALALPGKWLQCLRLLDDMVSIAKHPGVVTYCHGMGAFHENPHHIGRFLEAFIFATDGAMHRATAAQAVGYQNDSVGEALASAEMLWTLGAWPFRPKDFVLRDRLSSIVFDRNSNCVNQLGACLAKNIADVEVLPSFAEPCLNLCSQSPCAKHRHSHARATNSVRRRFGNLMPLSAAPSVAQLVVEVSCDLIWSLRSSRTTSWCVNFSSLVPCQYSSPWTK